VQITTVFVFPPSAGRKILQSQSRPIARDAANRTDEEEARRGNPIRSGMVSRPAWYPASDLTSERKAARYRVSFESLYGTNSCGRKKRLS
jgi:hypothetical protein